MGFRAVRPPLADPCAWVSVKPSSIFSAFAPGFTPGFSQRLVACSPTPSPHSLLRTCFDFYLPGSSQTGVPPGDRRHAHGRFPAQLRAASGLSEGNSSRGTAGSPGKGRPRHTPPTASRRASAQAHSRPAPRAPGLGGRAGRLGLLPGGSPGSLGSVEKGGDGSGDRDRGGTDGKQHRGAPRTDVEIARLDFKLHLSLAVRP